MPTLTALLVNGNSVNGPRNWGLVPEAATQSSTAIDEPIASADGQANWAADKTNNVDSSWLLTNVNSDLANMDTLSFRVRYSRASTTDDNTGLLIRIVTETNGTVLAAADSGGTFQTVVANGRDGSNSPVTWVTGSVTAFTYVNTTATKANWDDARIELRGTYASNMGADSAAAAYVDTLEITGTYTSNSRTGTAANTLPIFGQAATNVPSFGILVANLGATSHWRLNETSGSTAVDTLGPYDLTKIGGSAADWGSAGVTGDNGLAVDFTGGTYFRRTNTYKFTSNAAKSIVAIVKTNAAPGSGSQPNTIAGAHDTVDNTGWALTVLATSFRVEVNDTAGAGGLVSLAKTPKANTWYFVAATSPTSSGSWTLYAGEIGVETTLSSNTGSAGTPTDDTSAFIIGGHTGGSLNQWGDGLIDEVAVFDLVELSANDIQRLYTSIPVVAYPIGTAASTLPSFSTAVVGEATGTAFLHRMGKSVQTQTTQPRALWFSPDGLRMYVGANNAASIFQYALTYPWHLATATYVRTLSVTNLGGSTVRGVTFKPDGTIMYVTDAVSQTVDQHALSTPWDISTATYTQTSPSTSGIDDIVIDSATGTQAIVRGAGIRRYTMSTAWDISTLTISSGDVLVETNHNGLAVNADGTRLYVTRDTGDEVATYALATPWSPSTATIIATNSLAAQTDSPWGAYLRPGGDRLYLVEMSGDEVEQYTVPAIRVASSAQTLPSFTTDADGTVVNVEDPTNLQASQVGDDVQLTWDAPVLPGATHVHVFRRTGTSTAPFDPRAQEPAAIVAVGAGGYLDVDLGAGDYVYQAFSVIEGT